MPRPPKAEDKAYGETKKPRQFLITDTASVKLDEAAEKANLSRSEFMERLIRCINDETIEAVKGFDLGSDRNDKATNE